MAMTICHFLIFTSYLRYESPFACIYVGLQIWTFIHNTHRLLYVNANKYQNINKLSNILRIFYHHRGKISLFLIVTTVLFQPITFFTHLKPILTYKYFMIKTNNERKHLQSLASQLQVLYIYLFIYIQAYIFRGFVLNNILFLIGITFINRVHQQLIFSHNCPSSFYSI